MNINRFDEKWNELTKDVEESSHKDFSRKMALLGWKMCHNYFVEIAKKEAKLGGSYKEVAKKIIKSFN